MRSIIISPVLKCGNWRQFFFFFFVRVQCVDVISIVLKHGDFQAQAAETEQPRDRVSQRAFDGAKLPEARLTNGPGR